MYIPAANGTETIAAMDNDIKLTIQGQGDYISFYGLHLASSRVVYITVSVVLFFLPHNG